MENEKITVVGKRRMQMLEEISFQFDVPAYADPETRRRLAHDYLKANAETLVWRQLGASHPLDSETLEIVHKPIRCTGSRLQCRFWLRTKGLHEYRSVGWWKEGWRGHINHLPGPFDGHPGTWEAVLEWSEPDFHPEEDEAPLPPAEDDLK